MATDTRTVVGGGSLRIPMSFEEWEALGETKHHEWSGGILYVNPPNRRHVMIAQELVQLLRRACPQDMWVYPEWGFRTPLGDFEPDLMVAPFDLPDTSYVAVAPLLVVEVTSPTTADVDRDLKLRAYGAGGADWYWMVDAERLEVKVYRNEDGSFVEVQRFADQAETIGPFPVTIVCERLVPNPHV